MDPRAAEKTVVLVCRGLAAAFAVTGLFFLFAGDAVVDLFDDVGDSLGSFAEGPDTDQKLWLSLGFAYMTVITGIALVVASDPARYRPFLLVLAAGKAASSLTSGAFFLDDDVFIYLANFLVDGSLVAVSLWCWSLAGRIEQGSPAEPG